MAQILEWFWELHAGRTGNGFGPDPITWPAIDAWSRVTGTDLQPWEVRALIRLDCLWLDRAANPPEPELPKYSAAARKDVLRK